MQYLHPTYIYLHISLNAQHHCQSNRTLFLGLSDFFIIISISHLSIMCLNNYSIHHLEVILRMRAANERQCYKVTSSLIGWAYTQNDSWWVVLSSIITNNSLHSYIMRFPKTIACSPNTYLPTTLSHRQWYTRGRNLPGLWVSVEYTRNLSPWIYPNYLLKYDWSSVLLML